MIEDALSAGRVAIAVACHALVDIIVVDLCVQKGFDTGLDLYKDVSNSCSVLTGLKIISVKGMYL